MIEYLWQLLSEDVWGYLVVNYDPLRDTLDIALVAFAIYWLLVLIRGTRAVQILLGLIILIGASLASQTFELRTIQWILENFLGSAVIIIIVLFQHDIRRALARMGGGFFPTMSRREETQILEEIVRAAQTLAQRRVGALVVLERETHLSDLIEAGTPIDAAVSKELLISLFLPYSPLHDGAAVVQDGRVAFAGCILPLTLREDLPEGVGTRHRAAVGITEESDAVVVVVSEETSTLSVVFGGEMVRDLDGPRLREILRDILTGEQGEKIEEEAGGEAEETPAVEASR
ncbi:MAG: diadenylate cyclase CdaA [Myxococcota bacterium]|nr:diadenylate cyclase CdaA [Myxococcota bacterium]